LACVRTGSGCQGLSVRVGPAVGEGVRVGFGRGVAVAVGPTSGESTAAVAVGPMPEAVADAMADGVGVATLRPIPDGD
jgi:hypothetical protein